MRSGRLCILLAVFAAIAISIRRKELPVPSTSVATVVSHQTCAECHQEQTKNFESTGHYRAITPASDRSLARRFEDGQAPHPVQYQHRSGKLGAVGQSPRAAVPVDWFFGSGRHAQTPVSLYHNSDGVVELLQHHVSWYPQHGLGWTLGSEDVPAEASGPELIGKRLDPAATRECFQCHCTVVPETSGKIDPRNLIAGISCERCHPQSAIHAVQQSNGLRQATGIKWSDMDPLSAVNHCGECHRRADHFTASELTPQNRRLIRFAPVGLVQSRCFQEQTQARNDQGQKVRFDCVTCHDPHQPQSKSPAEYSQSCRQCHGSHPDAATICTGPQTHDRCVECHLPKHELQQHLFFTDHWIRRPN